MADALQATYTFEIAPEEHVSLIYKAERVLWFWVIYEQPDKTWLHFRRREDDVWNYIAEVALRDEMAWRRAHGR